MQLFCFRYSKKGTISIKISVLNGKGLNLGELPPHANFNGDPHPPGVEAWQ